jgi:hypothetical protein
MIPLSFIQQTTHTAKTALHEHTPVTWSHVHMFTMDGDSYTILYRILQYRI